VSLPETDLVAGYPYTFNYFAYKDTVNTASPVTLSLVSPASDNPAVKAGLIVTSSLNIADNKVYWMVPAPLTYATFALRLGAISSETGEVLVDQSSTFKVGDSTTTNALVVELASLSNYKSGDQITYVPYLFC
jgi:hypothetical protein